MPISAVKGHAANRWRGFAHTHFRALVLQNGLARETNAMTFNGKHFDQHLIGFFEFSVDIGNTMLSNFADVQQTIGSGEDFHKGAKFSQPNDFPEVGLPYFGYGREIADHLQGLSGCFLVVGSDVDFAGVIHINLDSGRINDAPDNFAARANEIANLIYWNLQSMDARSVFGDLSARLAQNFIHAVEDEQSSLAGLLQGFAHDRGADVGHLDIHCRAVMPSRLPATLTSISP